MMRLFVFFCVLAVAFSQDPSYDHQTKTYVGKVAPVTVTETVSVTPFFSPDHSIDTETDLIVSAQSIIRLGIPGFDSWGNCTWASNTSYGCTCAQQRNETFPIFPALLNALNKGIKVQILTNNYSQPYYPNLIDPLAFLQLAGADVRSFTTVTFIHSKYISVDGKKAAVSSVNFSKASFMFNREAGLLIEGSPEIQEFLDGVFDSDFAIATPWNTIQYSASDMAIIKDKTALPVIIPPANKLNNSYITPATTVTDKMQIQAIASPDLSYNTITAAMENATSVKLFIYQITDDMCDYISNNSKIFKTIFVSNEIYDKTDYYAAKACYTRLYNQGLSIRKTEEHVFKYSHQKFWIIDDSTVFLSTGNWGTTDYPNGSVDYPPFTSSSWRKINRDFTIQITNPEIVSIFSKVLEEDYERGWDWWPYNPSEEEKEN